MFLATKVSVTSILLSKKGCLHEVAQTPQNGIAGNTKGRSITVLLTSCLTGLD